MKKLTLSLVSGLILVGHAGPAAAQVSLTSNAFNPAISLILDGKFAAYEGGETGFDFPAFPLAEETGPAPEGLSLGESELVFGANVDDRFYGFMTVALHQDEHATEVELEEAWIQTLSMPGGLSLKAGRMYSDIGYHNSRHPHTWDFADAPLAYDALLGGNFGDSGLQARWVAPADLLVEFGAELLRGDSYPAAGAGNRGTGAWTAFARLGGDLGISNSWRLGLSHLSAQVDGREFEAGENPGDFTGEGSVTIVDALWKWAENGNPRQHSLVVQAEYLLRDEDGVLSMEGETLAGASPYALSQDGFYLQGVYQFRPRWRVGLRYDRLNEDNRPLEGDLAELLQGQGAPSRVSAMLDYSHSEFSRLRFQVASLDDGVRSQNQFFIQYVISLGAHGAHQF